jgi:hypothetical protein
MRIAEPKTEPTSANWDVIALMKLAEFVMARRWSIKEDHIH